MSYENASGELWHGLFADGTIDMKKVAQRYELHYGSKMKHYHTAIVDMLNYVRKRDRRKPPYSAKEDNMQSSSQCRAISTCVGHPPICETYVLSASRKRPSSTIPTVPYASAVIAELSDMEPDRLVIFAFSNCRDLEECIKNSLAELGFTARPQHSYHQYKKFSNAVHRMLEDSIEYFEAPCCKLFKHLKFLGFTGDHSTL